MARLPKGVTSLIRKHINDLITDPTPGQDTIRKVTQKQRTYRYGQRAAAGTTAAVAAAAAGVREALRDEDPDKITDALIKRLAKQMLKKEGVPIPRGRTKAPVPRSKDKNLETALKAEKDIEDYYKNKRKNKMAMGGMATPSTTPPRPTAGTPTPRRPTAGTPTPPRPTAGTRTPPKPTAGTPTPARRIAQMQAAQRAAKARKTR